MIPVIRSWDDYPLFDRLGHLPFHIGEYYTRRAQPIHAHRHEFLELSLVIEGESHQYINNQKYSMHPGTFTLLLPYQVCEELPPVKPMRQLTCFFDLGFLLRFSEIVPGFKDLLILQEELPPSIHLDKPQFDEITASLRSMLREYQDQELWREGMLQSKLAELLIRFERLRRQNNSNQHAAVSADQSTIWPIIHYIHTHYHQSISLTDISRQFGIGRSHLSTEFKKYTGLTFIDFLREVRIRHACSLLVSSKMSGIDIAIEVGFSSFKSFARAFSALKGMTPNQYRSKQKKTP